MKKILFLLFFITLTVNGADKQRHKDMSTVMNNYLGASKSTTPNKALVYYSSRTDIDHIDYEIVTIDSSDVSDGAVEITRGSNPKNKNITVTQLEACQADYGKVTIQATKLIVYTDRLPVSVRCTGASGAYREFYQTISED